MANTFIKWWKTKIVNGYKQFSGSNGYSSNQMSDTERLLGSDSGFGNNDISCSTPPSAANYTELKFLPNNEKDKINLEKISYVSMESGFGQSGQERQEFSFTLYDFDGHGKITKDDIAGLVTTIYETLKSYVQVPYYGSKTIKVQLFISPNQKKSPQNSQPSEQNQSLDKKYSEEPKNNVRQLKQDSGVQRNSHRKTSDHYRATEKRTHRIRREPFCCNFVCPEINRQQACGSGHNRNEEEVPACHDRDHETDNERDGGLNFKAHTCTCTSQAIPRYPTKPAHTQKYNVKNSHTSRRFSLCPVFCTKTWRCKNRSSSLQRQELLEIIQANMDKNNYRFQTTRRKQIPKTYLPQMSVSDYEQQPEEKHKLQPNIQLNDITHMMSSPNYLVNLSSLNSTNLCKLNRTNKLNLPYSHYDKLLNVVASMSGRHTSTDTHTHHKHQNCKCGQPRHHSLNPSYPSTNTTATKRISPSKASCYLNNFIKRPIERVHSRSKLYESKFEQSPSLKKHSKKISRIILSHTNSPHYLKHQNRQENQARAMAQVVRWLEKEVSTNVTIKNRLEKKLGKNKSKPHCISDKKTPVHFKVTNPNLKYTQRHKHHHVHKYIHHHYHHF